MNGVSRFLSRRDKNHEKRKSKRTGRGKVYTPFLPPHSSEQLLASVGSPGMPRRPSLAWRERDCLRPLRAALPSAWKVLAVDGVPFLRLSIRNTTSYTPLPTAEPSDHLNLQTSTNPPPAELYKVFTNEDLKQSDKDAEKNVSPPLH